MSGSLLFLLLSTPSFAQDGTNVTCGSVYSDADFDDVANPEDDDCTVGSYSGLFPCTAPVSSPSPDRVLTFTTATDAWVEVIMTWGRVDLNFYVLEDMCGTMLSCATGFGGPFGAIGGFTADVGEDYFVVYDEPGGGPTLGPPGRNLDVDFNCCFDLDGDGLYDMAGCLGPPALADCDDSDPNNFLGNPEVCDGADNDCDGAVDEGLLCNELVCDDGLDNDGDGDTDCVDSDCAFDPACCDLDGDGWLSMACGAIDCDDNEPLVNPGLPETTCDGLDNDCDPLTLDAPDGDGDGSDVCTDCNDGDPNNYPGNTETCDGLDNDCDTVADNGLTYVDYYQDADGDGYGDAAGSPTSTCDGPPAGGVADNSDCDDSNPYVNPGMAESPCNGVDDDCNALTADAADGDGDGVDECSDCDDGDAANYPGNVEICDGVDNDCDTVADNGVVFVDYYPDGDVDGYGDPLGPVVSACDGAPPGTTADNSDCDDTNAAVNPGQPEVLCDLLDNDCDSTTADSSDVDSDGVDECSDCDDTDPNNFPGNLEVCDGVDNDCDTVPDNGLTFVDYYIDGDLDGYGDLGGSATSTCNGAPAGTVADNTDCDDVNPAVNPGMAEATCNGLDDDCDISTVDSTDGDADGVSDCTDCDDADPLNFPGNPEVCDGADNDCDTVADNGIVYVDYYPDTDGDGYGDLTALPVSACNGAPVGHVLDNTDCDDADPLVNPGESEVVADGIDQDCDGVDICHIDADGDGVGIPATVTGTTVDCTGPNESDRDDDCDDTDPLNFPGNVEFCDGFDNDCDTLIDENTTILDYYPDLDADGFGDGTQTPFSTCAAPPAGMVLDDTDCDDTNPYINPGMTEITCNGVDEDCDGTTLDAPDNDGDGTDECLDCDDTDPSRSRVDADGDGVDTCDFDCDDNDPTRYPGATEVANGIDEDCNGTVDETTDWYDDDGDGYTELGGDCDDGDASINPVAIEVCDGIDQDCDTLIDEGTECYDDDGDGFTELEGDCNDGDAVVYPGQVEDLANGIDDDCDGVTDDGAVDFDGDGFTGLAGDCDDTDATIHPAAIEVCDGIDQDCDTLIDEDTECSDDDGDGFTELDGDCNDADAEVHPDAVEDADGVDDDCDGVVDNDTEVYDDDGDGFSEVGGDCDDDDDQRYPGAPERDNGLDDDCDGEVDEGLDDLDGDGYSELEGDCDDRNGWMNPGAVEICDNLDNDCDGKVDNRCAAVEDGALEDPAKCGCSSSGTGVLPGVLLLLLVGARRRRASLSG